MTEVIAPPSPKDTDSILERFITYKGQNIDVSSMERLATRAASDPVVAQRVNTFLLSEQRDTQKIEEEYLKVLLEWYKTNVDKIRVLLLRHVPVCLYLQLQGKTDALVAAILLCIYNVTVSDRTKIPPQKRNEKLLRSLNGTKTIYNIAGGEFNQTPNAIPLTARSLSLTNQMDKFDIVPRKDHNELPYETEILSERIPRIIWQTFNSYLDSYTEETLVNAAIVIFAVASRGMPYEVPKYIQIVGKDLKDERPRQRIIVDLKTNAISFEPLEGELAKLAPLTHLQQLQSFEIQSQKPTEQRVPLHESVLAEFVQTLRYSAFNTPRTESAAFAVTIGEAKSVASNIFESIYAMYVRGLYDSNEEVILQTQAILQQL